MLSEEQEQLLDAYFRGALDAQEKAEFEARLQADEAFRQEFEARKVVTEGLEMLSVRQELEGYLREMDDEDRTRSLRQRRTLTGIAASVLILVMATSWAAYKLGWLDGLFRKSQPPEIPPQEIPADSTEQPVPKQPSAYQYGVQRIIFHAADDNYIEGGLGTAFQINAASLLDASGRVIYDSVKADLVEIINPEHIGELTAGSLLEDKEVVRIFYFLPFYEKSEIEFNSLQPPLLLVQPLENMTLYYGGASSSQVAWGRAADHSPELIKAPTPEMDAYKRFVEGRIFLDSIGRFYTRDNGFYKPSSGLGRQFTVDYVQAVDDFVNGYLNSPYVRENVLEARRQWEIYQAQHTVEINRSEEYDYTATPLTLYKPGWYALIRE